MQDLLSKLSTNPVCLIENPDQKASEDYIKIIGGGVHSHVYKSNVEKKVIKKFCTNRKEHINDMWILYALAVISADEKDIQAWMPNFDAMYINLETKEAWTVIEELSPLKNNIHRQTESNHGGLINMNTDSQKVEDLTEFYGQTFHRVQVFSECRAFDAYEEVQDKVYAQLVFDFLSETFQKFNLPMMFDIHESNIMWRGDQPVITDPLGTCGEEHIDNMYDCIRHYAAKSDRVILIDNR